MAGHYPRYSSQDGGSAPSVSAYREPAGPPPRRTGQGPYALPPRRPPRRTTGGTVVAALGSMAAVFVLAILAVTLFGQHGDQAAGSGGRPGTRAARAAATDNKLYRTGALTPVNCRAPHITAAGTESMRRFMEVLTGCLDASWQRQFVKAGLRYSAPTRVFWSEPGRSPCGSYPQPGAAAFYCPANNAM